MLRPIALVRLSGFSLEIHRRAHVTASRSWHATVRVVWAIRDIHIVDLQQSLVSYGSGSGSGSVENQAIVRIAFVLTCSRGANLSVGESLRLTISELSQASAHCAALQPQAISQKSARKSSCDGDCGVQLQAVRSQHSVHSINVLALTVQKDRVPEEEDLRGGTPSGQPQTAADRLSSSGQAVPSQGAHLLLGDASPAVDVPEALGDGGVVVHLDVLVAAPVLQLGAQRVLGHGGRCSEEFQGLLSSRAVVPASESLLIVNKCQGRPQAGRSAVPPSSSPL